MKNGALLPEPLEKSEMGLLKGGFLEVEGEGGVASRANDKRCGNNRDCAGNTECYNNTACIGNGKCYNLEEGDRPVQ